MRLKGLYGMASLSRTSGLVLLFLAYVVACSLLRYRRRDGMAKRFNYPTRQSLASMTTDDAQAIIKILSELEFPAVFSTSVFFALFKTYGIPSISRLLCATGQLSSSTTSSKRAADTGVILTEVVINKPTSKRTIDGIARMNYLHSGYRKAGKISDADMLYTLSLFALEPIRWTRRFEWRALTDMETCAIGTFWKDLGDAMEIPYTALKSEATGFHDGLQWLQELDEWSMRYEEANMVPDESNKQLAIGTMDLLLWNLPRRFRGLADSFVVALLEPRLRIAMMLPKPQARYYVIVNTFMTLRKSYLRLLALPRPSFMRKPYIPDAPNPHTGRYNSHRYRAYPWYVKPTFSRRWGLKAWQIWMVGGTLPGDNGAKYHPEGYLINEVGPQYQKDKGGKQMSETRSRLAKQNRGGCPFKPPPFLNKDPVY